jgi:hypothetical protein
MPTVPLGKQDVPKEKTMPRLIIIPLLFILLFLEPASAADEPVDLLAGQLKAFKLPVDEWQEVGEVALDPDNPRKLKASPGKGVWYNGAKGRARDLYTKGQFEDVEVNLEFLIPKGSNSGIKFHGHYEIQIEDSFGVKDLTGHHCGGVYPRADLKPSYHHIDKGIAPRVNACKPAGQWQSLSAVFKAPRFDDKGKKIANAMLVKVVFNGQLIHENQELLTPTGHNWRNPEMAVGPLMLQADHGPVAFRKVTARSLTAGK